MDKAKFKLLQAKWYSKLKADGFEDIEDEYGSLKVFNLPRTYPGFNGSEHGYGGGRDNDRFAREKSRQIFNTRYYSLCRAIRYTEAFKKATVNNPRHCKIWDMHCEGATYVQIAKTLKISHQCAKWVVYKLRPLVKEANESSDDDSDSDT